MSSDFLQQLSTWIASLPEDAGNELQAAVPPDIFLAAGTFQGTCAAFSGHDKEKELLSFEYFEAPVDTFREKFTLSGTARFVLISVSQDEPSLEDAHPVYHKAA